MYNYVIDSLIAGINPVYLTQITGASYNIYDNVYCKKCNSIMQYNVQKNYFRCTNYQCSTKIHGFSPLPFNYHKEDIRKLLLIYANFVMIYQYFVLQKIYQFQNMKFHDGILSFVNKCQTKF